MADGPFLVQWTGKQAVVTLPVHIDHSNAEQMREQLLWIINRGAAVLIADLTGTVSCDHSGADALARAQHRAIANGTELRLVATDDDVRHVLSLNGFDRLVAFHPDLDGAIAAGAERGELDGEEETQIDDRAARAEELLSRTADTISSVGSILRPAIDLPSDITAQRIAEALDRLDEVVREILNHVFAERVHGGGPGVAEPPSPDLLERSALARNHTLLLRMHVAQAARAMQSTAADTAALLDRRANYLGWHARVDYPTEIKRWQVLADQAGQMAAHWEQQP
jgi:anti-anti-sigma factor